MSHTHDYQVTALKWRPTAFSAVVGQEHITQTLLNAIKSGRLHHAYLFSGPRGVGKTTTARILAKALNCLNPGPEGEPCNGCESCAAITEGRSMDVVEIDGASNNSVDDIRALRDSAKYPPISGRYKLYIIDEVHMLSTSAFNALLKTLEEPPKHLIFIFATTEPHKVLLTILSRCQRFDFRRMQIEDIIAHLRFIAEKEGMTPEEEALGVIARKADGSMRDAQSIFDQVRAFCGEDFTYAQINEALNLIDQEFYFGVTDMMKAGDPAVAFGIVEQIMRTGYDIGEFLVGLAEHFRNTLSVLTLGSPRLIETTEAIREKYGVESRRFAQGDIIRALHLTLGAQREIRTVSQPRLRLELLLIQLAVMDETIRLEELLAEIRRMPDDPPGAPSSPPPSSVSTGEGEHGPPSTSPPAGTNDERNTTVNANGNGRHDNGTDGGAPVEPPAMMEMGAQSMRSDALSGLRNFPTGAPPRTTPQPVRREERSDGGNDNATMSIDEVRARWPSFREQYNGKPRLMFALEPATPSEVQGNVLHLCVENERQRELIDQYKEDITTSIRTFFKQPLIVEGVVGRPPQPNGSNGSGGDPAAPAGARPPEEDHPFVKGIIDLLGAVRL